MLRSLSAVTVLASLVAGASLATLGMTTACSSSSSSSGGSSGGNCDTGGANGMMCNAPGSSNPTPAFDPCVTGSALQSPTISFATDIQPIWNASCAISGATCHGSPVTDPKTTGQIYLGSPDGGVAASDILPKVVGQPSPENGAMDIIKAGDPVNSYMMHKIDGDECLYAKTCNATQNAIFTNCGIQMPYNSGVLDQGSRDKIRRWIAQGAQSN
jgi:hypothetical protein